MWNALHVATLIAALVLVVVFAIASPYIAANGVEWAFNQLDDSVIAIMAIPMFLGLAFWWGYDFGWSARDKRDKKD